MKWGVRRYQNLDRTWTEEGKIRYGRQGALAMAKKQSDVDDIISTWNSKDRERFNLGKGEEYMSSEKAAGFLIKRILVEDGDKPVAFFDLLKDADNTIQVALGVRSGDQYRGKGYASKASKEGIDWYKKNSDWLGYDKVIWAPMVENTASRRLAEKNGFVLDPTSYSDDKKWVNYELKLKRAESFVNKLIND